MLVTKNLHKVKTIKDLIESNLRQRVLGNTNPVKLGRCFEFLNNWYGFIQGTNQYSFTKVLCSSEKHNPKNQTELAESYGITQQTMNNYMRMASMIPELEDLVDTGIVTKDTALAIIKNLTSDEQRELIIRRIIIIVCINIPEASMLKLFRRFVRNTVISINYSIRNTYERAVLY